MMDEIANNLYPQRCLVCAIVAQAVRDCRKPTTREGLEALRWLASREVEEWCLGWGVDIERLQKVVNNNVVERLKMV